MLKRKLIKLARWAWWAFPTVGAVPVHWHVGRPNFGDDLNPVLLSRILKKRVYFKRDQRSERLLGMGSILHKSDSNATVVGSGLLNPADGTGLRAKAVIALRGELSVSRTKLSPQFLGDPAIFLPRFFEMSLEKTHRFGFIPHHSETATVRNLVPRDWLFIDPAWSPMKVLSAICRCESVVSRSLHGLICADAYGVRNAWLEPLGGMQGGSFKFLDYYSTMSDPKKPIQLSIRRLRDEAASFDYSISRYRYSLDNYLDAIQRVTNQVV